MSAIFTVLIADDQPLMRRGVRQVIETDSSFRVVHEAGDGHEALQFIGKLKPHFCVLDIKMPVMDGLDVARQMRERGLPGEVMFLTMKKEESLFHAALALDVKGFVFKDCPALDILACLRNVAAGRRYFSPGCSDFLAARCADTLNLRRAKPGLERLTPAERRILKLVAGDKTSKEIADDLGRSLRTVQNHRTNICAKLDVHGIHSLVKFAFQNKASL